MNKLIKGALYGIGGAAAAITSISLVAYGLSFIIGGILAFVATLLMVGGGIIGAVIYTDGFTKFD